MQSIDGAHSFSLSAAGTPGCGVPWAANQLWLNAMTADRGYGTETKQPCQARCCKSAHRLDCNDGLGRAERRGSRRCRARCCRCRCATAAAATAATGMHDRRLGRERRLCFGCVQGACCCCARREEESAARSVQRAAALCCTAQRAATARQASPCGPLQPALPSGRSTKLAFNLVMSMRAPFRALDCSEGAWEN